MAFAKIWRQKKLDRKKLFTGPDDTGYLDEMKLWADPEYQGSIKDFIEAGGYIEVVIHKNTSPFIRKLGREGKIAIFYELHESPYITQFSDNHIYSKLNKAGEPEFGIIGPYEETLRKVTERYDSEEKHPVLPGKVDDVFGMIGNGFCPNEIVDFLYFS